jgi:hypothetical protein
MKYLAAGTILSIWQQAQYEVSGSRHNMKYLAAGKI